MPLPLIPVLLWGSAAIGGLIGAKKGLDGKANLDAASALKAHGERSLNAAQQEFEEASQESRERVSELGQLRLETQAGVMSRLAEVVSRVEKFSFVEVRIKDAPALQGVELAEIQSNSTIAKDILQGAAMSVGASTAAYGSVTALVGALGTASTGASISGLSGAAATKATMAYLGGGAISSGGLGAAAGAAALSATAVGAFAGAAGFAFEKYSEGKLTEAAHAEAEKQVAAAELSRNAVLVRSLGTRASEVAELIRALATRLEDSLDPTEQMVGLRTLQHANFKLEFERDKLKFDSRSSLVRLVLKLFGKVPVEKPSPLAFSNFHAHDKALLETSVSLGIALFQTLKIELVNEVGELCSEVEGKLAQVRDVLEGIA